MHNPEGIPKFGMAHVLVLDVDMLASLHVFSIFNCSTNCLSICETTIIYSLTQPLRVLCMVLLEVYVFFSACEFQYKVLMMYSCRLDSGSEKELLL